MEHQKKLLDETKDRNLVAYFVDMGGGKTFIGSEKALSFDEDIILIVCQKSKVRDWGNHFFDYYIDKTKCDESGAWYNKYNMPARKHIKMNTKEVSAEKFWKWAIKHKDIIPWDKYIRGSIIPEPDNLKEIYISVDLHQGCCYNLKVKEL
jgi:hypothetical protein